MLPALLRRSNVVFLDRPAPPPVLPESSPVHVAFEHLSKSYAGPNGVKALDDVSFTVRRGEIFGIIGRSGAGKSTLIRTVNMLERPSSGRVVIDDGDIGRYDEESLLHLRRRVGMVFQHFNLLSAKTVRDNVGLPMKVAGAQKEDIRKRVDFLLDLVGLADKADVYPAKLSGGQKQRVGIARALVHNPEILLCDEATSALDPETTQSILSLLKDVSERLGLTIILITHDMAVIRAICDRVLVLDGGKIAEQGEVWQVFGNPRADATRALLSPLQHGLPADVASSLIGTPPANGTGEAILSLQLTGESDAEGLTLSDLTRLSPRARLIHGGLDRIQGHAQGRLLVAIPATALHNAAALALLSSANFEVIGYVPDDV